MSEKMSNNTIYKSENVINEACNTYLINDRSNSLQIKNNNSITKTTSDIANHLTSNSAAASSSSSSSSEAAAVTAPSNSFVNGDLIDLCDQINEHDHLNEYSKYPVEAINSQLLADLNGKALQQQQQQQPSLMVSTSEDCHILYPTKVSFDNVISGTTQRKHANQPNGNGHRNTVVSERSAEAIGRSGESNLIASVSALPPPTNEQHQTHVIREFKRIGTYCTLRPEQRRKHLLKVLPTLRNSMLLQTLFGSNTTPKNFTKTHNNNNNSGSSSTASTITTTDDEQKQQQQQQQQQQHTAGGNHDIDSLLIDLDDFIIDSNIMRMQRLSNHETLSNAATAAATLNSNSNSSQYGGPMEHSDELTTGYMKIVDPDKVEDCLLELDAYLEEIDRDYVLACAAHGPNTMISVMPSTAVAETAAASQPRTNASIVGSTIGINSSNGNSMKISANECVDEPNALRNHISVRPPPTKMDNNNCIDCECNDRRPVDNDCIIHTNAIATVAESAAPNLRKEHSSNAGEIQMNDYRIVGMTAMANNETTNGSRTLDNQRKSTNDIANNQPLKRGHKLRNTVAGSGHNQNRAIVSYDAPSQYVDTSTRDTTRPTVKNVALSWRRLSMRKTCPIVLPEQNSPKNSTSSAASSQYAIRPLQILRTTSAVSTSPITITTTTRSNALVTDFTNTTANAIRSASNFGNENYNYTEIRTHPSHGETSTDDYMLMHSVDDIGDEDGANDGMPSTLNGVGQQQDLIDYDRNNQLPELSSLNSEFLNTILSTQNYQQSTNLSHNNNNNNNSSSSNTSTPMHHETNFVEQDCNENGVLSPAVANATAVANTFDDSRPRQLGRRSEMRSRIVSITAERIAEGNPRIIVNCDTTDNVQSVTPSNCSPSTNLSTTQSIQSQSSSSSLQRLSTQCQSSCSSVASSRNPSPISIASSSESSSGGSTSAGETNIRSTSSHRTMNASCEATTSQSNRTNNNSNSSNSNNGNSASSSQRNQLNSKTRIWPFGISRIFAATCCTLGLFNMSRFSIFSIIFGANFIVQFLLLSFFLGIPMLWLQMCLGSNIRGGPISMWRVSPICKGIGIALVLVQALMTIYSAVSIAWLLTYLRDSCVSTRYPWYRWQEIFEFFRGPSDNGIAIMSNTSEPSASASKLGETVADYFNGIILQRYQLGSGGRAAASSNGIGAIRFQLAFNLSAVWLLVFVILCKGLRFYGKIVIGLVAIPMITFFALTTKMLTLLDLAGFQNIFPATDWQDFFVNSQSWLSAAQEAFLTWSLLGASIISIFSKPSKGQQDGGAGDKTLRRDALLVVLFTLIGLLLAAVFGNACVQILNDRGFYYFPGSFETLTSSVFLSPSSKPMSPQLATSLSKWLPRYSTLLGESYKRIDPNSFESGWQPIRIVTEIFPATMAAATVETASSFWSLLGFGTFLLFGLAQLCAMWKPIATSMYSESISATSTTILLTCLAALLLGIPLTTESGINIIYFLDSVIGGAWFVLLLWTGLLMAIFLVRGRPYSGDILVNRLHLGLTLSAFVALSWNLLLPIGLLTLCVLQYKISYSYDFYHWSGIISQSYWPIWTRKAAAFIQIGIFQIIPITAIIQTYRYLSKGPPDILDRFQLLYRPPISASQRSHRYPRTDRSPHTTTNRQSEANTGSPSIPAIAVTLESNPSLILDDAPPKYTPPPSYTTATGARIAKLLRNSIRRSVRRIMGEPNCNGRRQRAALQTVESSFDQNPPEYSTIVSTSLTTNDINTTSDHDHHEQNVSIPPSNTNDYNHTPSRATHQPHHHHQFSNARRHTTTNFPMQKSLEKMDSFSSTMPRRQNPAISSTSTNDRFRNLTAQDVAQLLRSTPNTQLIRSESNLDPLSPSSIDSSSYPIDSDHCVTIPTNISMDDNNLNGNEDYSLTRSVEELILNEVPIGESNAAATFCDK